MKPRSLTAAICLIVSLSTAHLAAQTTKQSISQFGITWTFDKAYNAGQFVNGDWWVVGPVKIVAINPPSRTGTRVMHGSMLNPSPRNVARQGYDNTMNYTSYDAKLNVALDVSSSRTLSVPVNSSLVSTISKSGSRVRPQLDSAAILTVLPAAAAAGSFRPPYCGTDKRIKFHENQLQLSLLKSLQPAAGAPSLASVERMFERPWIDHIPGFPGREHHPAGNMKAYGRDLSTEASIGALMVHTNLPVATKKRLVIRYVQLGIDLNGVADDGGGTVWVGNGGHGSGRKWPILFAGLMLNDSHMKGIGSRNVAFGEDHQTFYVAETSPGVFNWGHGGYTSAHKDMPEWGFRHATKPQDDTVNWSDNYRLCCTANCWNGAALATLLMDAKQLWNHDPMFDYLDRYIAEVRRRNQPAWMLSWNDWTIAMWDLYRKGSGGGSKPGLKLSHVTRAASAFSRPVGVHTQAVVPSEVRLKWTAVSAAAVHEYRIYRGANASSLQRIGTTGAADPFYTDPKVAKGSYVYRVIAVDVGGQELAKVDAAIQV